MISRPCEPTSALAEDERSHPFGDHDGVHQGDLPSEISLGRELHGLSSVFRPSLDRWPLTQPSSKLKIVHGVNSHLC